jgi:hypothetical protein
MERPGLAGVNSLSRKVGEGLLATAQSHRDLARRDLIREVQKRLLRLSAFVLFDILQDSETTALVADTYTEVAAAVRLPKRQLQP